MATAFDNGTFTFNPEELKDLKQIINELTFNHPSISDVHYVEQGIKYDKQIVFAARMGLLGKALESCTPNAAEGITLTNKFWTPKLFDFRITHCSADVDSQDKLFNQWLKVNPDFYNIFEGSASSVGAYLVGLVEEASREDILTKIWFSDTTAATYTGSGVFTNGTDLDFFNVIDGLFKQIFVDVPTSAANYVAITKNAAATYALQALAAGEGMATLKAMYGKADSRLRGASGVEFLVTRTLFDAYLNDLESTQNTGAGNTFINEKGQLTLTYRGIPVKLMDIWDNTINTYQNNGTKWYRPHRAILTVPTNIPVGTPSEGDFGSVDAFYDKVTKMNYVDGAYGLDTKHLQNYLTVAAY